MEEGSCEKSNPLPCKANIINNRVLSVNVDSHKAYDVVFVAISGFIRMIKADILWESIRLSRLFFVNLLIPTL